MSSFAIVRSFAGEGGSLAEIVLRLVFLLTAVIGMALEVALLRKLYQRDHLSQVLATFALILIADEVVRMIWGPQALQLNLTNVIKLRSIFLTKNFAHGRSNTNFGSVLNFSLCNLIWLY